MRRFLLLLAVALIALAALAPSAVAWYAPAEHTAYIDLYLGPYDWCEWSADDPYNVTAHHGPIPAGWPVVVATSWADSQRGAATVTGNIFHTMRVQDRTGSWSFALPTKSQAMKCWSPPYEWNPVDLPGLWARDWWVPLGTPPPGKYTGTVREWAPEDFLTWCDDHGTIVDEPVYWPAFDQTLPFGFTVK
jgi:hypothetical protein